MVNNRYIGGLVVLSLLLAACGKTANDAAADSDDGGTGFVAGGSPPATGGSGGVSGPGVGGTGGEGSSTCTPGIPATSQIPRLLNRQYAAVVRDLLGVTALAGTDGTLSDQLVGDFTGPMSEPAWAVYQDLGAKIAHQVLTGPNKSKFINCEPSTAGCLEQTIKTFGRKAFRRPLTDAELARFQMLGQTTPAPTPDELAETTLFAFLVSPSFLLLPELATTSPEQSNSGPGIPLSAYELATRLSMLVWDSVPDDALNAAADADQLKTKDQLWAQAQRMLGVREKAARAVTGFHRDWAQMNNASGHWWKGDHDPMIFPLYSAAAKAAAVGELDAFFADIAFEKGSFKDFFLSNAAFVNQDNAAIYGLDPSSYGADLKRVELDAAQRPGFLTRAGFLSSYADYNSSSPMLRGAFIALNLLGITVPPPPPGIENRPLMGDFKTQREYVEALTSPEPCKSCHSIFNPAGFALENYDAIGKWQTVDARSGPIDATADVGFPDRGTVTIRSPLQLMQEIAKTPNAQRIYAQSWVSYAYQRPANEQDICIVDQLATRLASDQYPVLNVLRELTQPDSFRLRVRGN